jgi:ATP-binding cassette subfamily B multidrug efflux pump
MARPFFAPIRMFRFFETLIDPFRPHEPSMPPASLSGFYWRYTRQVWPVLAILLVTGLMVSLIEVALIGYVGVLVDLLGTTSPERLIADHAPVLLWMAFVLVVARPFANAVHYMLINLSLNPSFTNLVRWQTHRYVARQSIGFFTNDFAGRIASKIVQTGPALRESVVQICEALWFALVYVTGAIVLFAGADWRLTVPVILWTVAFFALLAAFVPRIRDRSTLTSDARSIVTGRLVDSYTNIQTVKLFADDTREDDYVAEVLADHTEKYRRQARLTATLQSAVIVANSMMIFGTMALAIWLWSTGELTLGAIAVAGAFAIRISALSGWIMWTTIGVFDAMGTVQEGLETIARPNDLRDVPGATPLVVTRGEIRFDGIRFHYGREAGVIDGLSLTVAPGERVGLVGRSGAGKSTLVNLLLRFYDLEGGRILIDGQDVAHVTQESLRRQIGVVTQDTSLLHRSIRDNIRYGRPDADEAAIRAAAERAHAEGFIPDLSDWRGRTGYDAHVGERGVKLSGGQRQRVAIARLILKDAPILVLDEATSALDSEVEAEIQASLYGLMEGRTVIAIAHRLSTIAVLDRLVVMDAGKIIETGTHAELLARDGLYAALWRRQSGGFLGLDPVAAPDRAAAAE